MNIGIELFHDTGCHLRFEPLAPVDAAFPVPQGGPEGPEEDVRSRIEANSKAIDAATLKVISSVASSDQSEWQPVESKPWLRVRLGRNKYPFGGKDGWCAVGLWLAIETNLGDYSRGIVVGTTPAGPEDQEKFKNVDKKSLPCPYRYKDEKQLPSLGEFDVHSFELKSNGEGFRPFNVDLTIAWRIPNNDVPIDVELVVDFGNTRTAALVLEHDPDIPSTPDNFSVRCPKVLLRRTAFDDSLHPAESKDCSDAITESWFVLREPLFSKFPAETKEPVLMPVESGWGPWNRVDHVCKDVISRLPQAFVRLSPAAFGAEALEDMHEPYTRLMLQRGGKIMQSSPKRHYWDNRCPHDKWNMTLRPSHKVRQDDPDIKTGLPQLDAMCLRMMYPDGAGWKLAEPPVAMPPSQRPQSPRRPCDPSDPPSATMVWMLCSVLECAWSQINSNNVRKAGQFKPRRIKSVVATYPSGWSQTELDSYRARWQEAINIFHLTNNPPNSLRPELVMNLDEAVASQLPFVFSGMNRMGNIGDNYLKLMGREVGVDNESHGVLRVMNADIGGGTSDISVIEYKDKMPGQGVALDASLLFKHSFNVAGDALVKDIISRVIIPVLCDMARNQEIEGKMLRPMQIADKMERACHVRMVLVPMATTLLREMSQSSYRPVTPADAGVDQQTWNAFLAWAGLPESKDLNAPMGIDYGWIERIIDETFADIVEAIARYAAAFDIDMMIISGKTSELPRLRRMIEEGIPVMPGKIISARGFDIGRWYPFAVEGCIADAKSVTVVGAALARALAHGDIQQYSMTLNNRVFGSTGNVWGTLEKDKRAFGNQFLAPKDIQSKTTSMMVGTLIGKAPEALIRFPDPVYKLEWRDGYNPGHNQVHGISFVRNVSDNGDSESIAVDPACEITDVHGNPVRHADLQLSIRPTWEEDEFWMDSGKLKEIDWNLTIQPTQ